jgi:5-formyltetrahydrofolate cyclo-ligase
MSFEAQLKTKQEFRLRVKKLKAELAFEEKKNRSNILLNKLEKLREFREANTILFYWSMRDEVYTHELIEKWYLNKTILLPSVSGDHLQLKIFKGRDKMISGEQFGIGEPDGEIVDDHSSIDMIVVPGIAFDQHNNRLGRGRGYYDKFLQFGNACKVGICFNFQLFPSIPVDKHDVPMDYVITD